MPHEYSRALLLANVVQFPLRKLGDHSSRYDTDKTPADLRHGIADPNEYINEFIRRGLVKDRYPNFSKIGFQSQAFIDIHLSDEHQDDTSQTNVENGIRQSLKQIENVVQIYTVFGDVDLRCKVVGLSLRDIERTAMQIRSIAGVKTSTTSIILDETRYDEAPDRWGTLIRNHAEEINHVLPKPPNRKPPKGG